MFDVGLTGAVLAGLLSFLSPCVLPMVPFYLSYLAGGTLRAMAEEGAPAGRRAVLPALAFAAGVATVFVGLGATATVFGQLVRDWFDVLRWGAAATVAVMGLHLLGVLRVGVLDRSFGRAAGGAPRGGGVAAGYGIGLAFAFGWTPCVGPVLAAILILAGGQEPVARGVMLLLAYATGMTAPFVAAAAFAGPALRGLRGIRQHLPAIERATGALLLVFAALIASDRMYVIAAWMLRFWPAIG